MKRMTCTEMIRILESMGNVAPSWIVDLASELDTIRDDATELQVTSNSANNPLSFAVRTFA